MQFLKSAINTRKNGFTAHFVNGETSTSLDCARFFMIMQEKECDIDSVRSHIRLGMRLDPAKDWTEIQRILRSFAGKDLQ